MKTVNLVQANYDRALAIAKVLVPRITKMDYYKDGPWTGWVPGEGLEGHLKSSDLLTYYRPGKHNASLSMGFLKMTDIKEQESSKPVLLSENIIESYTDFYNFEKPIEYEETIEHTFSKTVSFEESAKQAWEVAAKFALSAEYAGIKGSFEASAKYGQELSQRHSQSQTQTDRVSKTIKIKGPVQIKYEAKRSSSKLRQIVKAVCDFDFKLYFSIPNPKTGLGVWEWSTFQTLFLPQIKNVAPEDDLKNMNVWPVFENSLPTDGEIEAISKPSNKVIEFVVDYDNVNQQSLNVL